MTPDTPHLPTSSRNENSALVPLWFWRGAHPPLLDLTPDQAGWTLMLVLTRQDSVCLLPVALFHEYPPEEPAPHAVFYPLPHAVTRTNALNPEALQLTLNDLLDDGWLLSGKLDMHFTGTHTTPHFWRTVHTFLHRDAP